MLSRLFALLTFASPALAASSNLTATDCPSCDATACNSRSVWSLLASCGLTLLICVWHTVHPALPLPSWRWYHLLTARLCCMLVTFAAPEATVASAVAEWREAKQVTKSAHGRYKGWTITRSHFILNGGFVLCDSTGLKEIKVDEFLQLLDAKEIMNPVITEDDIKDKSSSDCLAKAILVVQLSWFMIQVVVRLANHLTVTLIELDTMCMALLTFPLIFFWWNKPFCAERPHIFHKCDASICSDLEVSANSNDTEKLLPGETPTITTNRGTHDFLFCVHGAKRQGRASFFLAWIMLGALHLVAWNYEFLTTSERILWRVASLALVGSPIFMSLGTVTDGVGDKAKNTYLLLLVIVGITSRLLLVSLMLASLRSLPSSAYQIIPWTAYIPHL